MLGKEGVKNTPSQIINVNVWYLLELDIKNENRIREYSWNF